MGGWIATDYLVKKYGWRIKLWEANVRQLLTLQDMGGKGKAYEAASVLVELIQEWDATDKNGNALPLSVESINELPNTVVAELLEVVFRRAAGLSDPKDDSESTPTTPREPGEKSPSPPQ